MFHRVFKKAFSLIFYGMLALVIFSLGWVAISIRKIDKNLEKQAIAGLQTEDSGAEKTFSLSCLRCGAVGVPLGMNPSPNSIIMFKPNDPQRKDNIMGKCFLKNNQTLLGCVLQSGDAEAEGEFTRKSFSDDIGSYSSSEGNADIYINFRNSSATYSMINTINTKSSGTVGVAKVCHCNIYFK